VAQPPEPVTQSMRSFLLLQHDLARGCRQIVPVCARVSSSARPYPRTNSPWAVPLKPHLGWAGTGSLLWLGEVTNTWRRGGACTSHGHLTGSSIDLEELFA
jgi:hypothetical protein